jgi:hypothetical protein
MPHNVRTRTRDAHTTHARTHTRASATHARHTHNTRTAHARLFVLCAPCVLYVLCVWCACVRTRARAPRVRSKTVKTVSEQFYCFRARAPRTAHPPYTHVPHTARTYARTHARARAHTRAHARERMHPRTCARTHTQTARTRTGTRRHVHTHRQTRMHKRAIADTRTCKKNTHMREKYTGKERKGK